MKLPYSKINTTVYAKLVKLTIFSPFKNCIKVLSPKGNSKGDTEYGTNVKMTPIPISNLNIT